MLESSHLASHGEVKAQKGMTEQKLLLTDASQRMTHGETLEISTLARQRTPGAQQMFLAKTFVYRFQKLASQKSLFFPQGWGSFIDGCTHHVPVTNTSFLDIVWMCTFYFFWGLLRKTFEKWSLKCQSELWDWLKSSQEPMTFSQHPILPLSKQQHCLWRKVI